MKESVGLLLDERFLPGRSRAGCLMACIRITDDCTRNGAYTVNNATHRNTEGGKVGWDL